MATISENLQTIKDSTDAIKQAIIDKGGEITGDITTWADAINGISGGGGSTEEDLIFTGTLSNNKTLTGKLNYLPFTNTIVHLIYSDNDMISSVSLSNGVDISNITESITLSTNGVPSPSGWYIYGVICRGYTRQSELGTVITSEEIKIAKIVLE